MLELRKQAAKEAVTHAAKKASDLSTDDVLAALGLRRRPSGLDLVLPAAGYFAAGMVFGAGLGLLLAPRSGAETRRQLKGKASDLTRRLGSAAEEFAEDVQSALPFRGEERTKAPGSESRKSESSPSHSSSSSTTPSSYGGASSSSHRPATPK